MLNQTRLPWLAALTAFLLYVCTMGSGLTLSNLGLVSQLAGWSDLPIVGQPLLWFITLPLRWLPAAWVAPLLKLLSAALAAAIWGLLVRTVQLLPWDRSWDQASRLVSTLPALTAVIVCGLEWSFWREATSTGGDLLDLLLLAAAGWLLLEYNVRRQVRWLEAAFLIWGAGMAENWVMLWFLPVFIIAVIWLERQSLLQGIIFPREFLWRLAGLLLAGFSIYLVLPMVNGLAPHSPWTLGQSWHASLHDTKNTCVQIYHVFWRAHRVLLAAVAVCYLAASLPLLVRLRDEDTHAKSTADRFQLRIYRVLRLGLLLACFWLAFDPTPAARQMIHAQTGGHLKLLSFDYLLALSTAFLLGNFLLVPYALDPQSYRSSRKKQWWQFAAPVAAGVVALLAVGLAVRNGPAICRANFHSLDQFGVTAVAALPPGRGILLGENSDELIALESALARQGRADDWAIVDTRALAARAYRTRLEAEHPAGWLANPNLQLTAVETVRLLEQVARTNQLYYLHPSFNLFFERFYLEPAGVIYAMKPRGKDPLNLPPMSAAVTEATEQYWNRLWDRELSALVPPTARPSRLANQLAHYGIVPAARDQDRMLAEWYSRPLENWAVRLQIQGRLREAHEHFEQVERLNTNNISARLSLACNTNLQSGAAMTLTEVARLAGEMGNARMELVLQGSGPFDSPAFNYLLGCMLLDRGMPLQSAEQLERVRTLVPASPAPEMKLAEIYNQLHLPERSRPLIAHLREMESAASDSSKNAFELNVALLDSYASLLQTNLPQAQATLRTLIQEHPDDPQIFNRVLGTYLSINDFTNALQLVETRLVKTPDDIPLLNAKAQVLVQSGHAAVALPIVDRILALTNTPDAHINRAVVRIDAGQYAAAQADLTELEQTVLKEHPDDPQIFNRIVNAYASFNDFTNALRLLETRLARTPDDIPLLSAKAQMLLQSGHAADALPIVDRILALTNTPDAHFFRAKARMDAGQFAAAQADLTELEQTLLKEHPDDPQIFNRLLNAYVSINDFTNGLRLLETRLARTPDDIPLLSTKARVLDLSGHAAAALPIVDRIILLTNTPAAHLFRAKARMDAGQFAAAKAELTELEKNGDALGPVEYNLAVVARAGGDTNTAIVYLQRCLTNVPVGQPLWRQANDLLQQISSMPKP